MKKVIILIVLTFTMNAIAQDGSDIKYISVPNLDNSYIGKMVHLDFYNRSLGGNLNFDSIKLVDKITIELVNKKIDFLEYRFDNGYNNWFSKQYLESIEFINGYKIRITMCKIMEIKPDFIKVVLFIEYKDKNGQLKSEKLNEIEYSFPKKILTEILVKS